MRPDFLEPPLVLCASFHASNGRRFQGCNIALGNVHSGTGEALGPETDATGRIGAQADTGRPLSLVALPGTWPEEDLKRAK